MFGIFRDTKQICMGEEEETNGLVKKIKLFIYLFSWLMTI
jgi:hypothetical protein